MCEDVVSVAPTVLPPMNPSDAALTPEHLHARYAAKIARRVRALMGREEEREDLVQEVLITVFRNIGTLRDPACIDGWVNQIIMNTLRYFLRRRRFRSHDSWDQLTEQHQPSVRVDFEARELATRVANVMKRLPASDREILTRYWFSPGTAEAIAADKDCSTMTVRRRLNRARNRFVKLARRDPALAVRLDEARRFSTRPRKDATGRARRLADAVAFESATTSTAA